jgi:tripartite-type tricarboxylate transporter receptor subunit TctC
LPFADQCVAVAGFGEGLEISRIAMMIVEFIKPIARRCLPLVLAIGVISAMPGWAQAAYPDHPVRVILPFAAGGVADITARLVADKLGDKLGQRFVIENQPGAGGITAARTTLAGGTDGYTLALFSNGTAISVSLFEHLPFDPLKDFTPLSAMGYFSCVFATNAASPLQTLGDVLKTARAKPGSLNIGSINVGSTQNLTAELFRSMAGIDAVLVPFRTTPEQVVALLRDDIQLSIDFYAALKPALQSGKARAVATSGAQRSPELADVPTVQEGGVPGFDVTSWNALYAPAGTPQPIIDTLNKALREVLADPEVKQRALDLGIDAKGSTPAEIDARMRLDIVKWSKVIESAKIPKQ